jgi:hypothetical protein
MAQAGLQGMALENRYQVTTASRNVFKLHPRTGGRRRWGVRRTESGAVIG